MEANNLEHLTNLYRRLILEHNKNPRNHGTLTFNNRSCSGTNPFCGDKIEIQLLVSENKDIVEKIAFQAQGCAICKASASILTTMIKNKSKTEVLLLIQVFKNMLMNEQQDEQHPSPLGKLMVFKNLHQIPSRIKCALLAWNILKCALEKTKNNDSKK